MASGRRTGRRLPFVAGHWGAVSMELQRQRQILLAVLGPTTGEECSMLSGTSQNGNRMSKLGSCDCKLLCILKIPEQRDTYFSRLW